jgi:hypothetical protein
MPRKILDMVRAKAEAEVELQGEKIRVRQMTMVLADSLQEAAGDGRTKAVARILKECVIGEDGQPYLTPEEAAEIADDPRYWAALIEKIVEISSRPKEKKD